MTKGRFVRGALILAAAGAVSRTLGLLYVVFLPRIIEDTGYGLFHMVRPIHYFASVMAVAGMPTAISKLVADKAARGQRGGVLRVLRLSMALLFVLGGTVSVGLLGSASWLAERILRDSGAYYPLVALAPSVLLFSLIGAWRGFFQGLQKMGPSALSQVVEQLVRVAATVGGALLFWPLGVEYAAGGAAFGSVMGAVAALATLMFMYYRHGAGWLAQVPQRRSDGETAVQLVKGLLGFAFPLMLGAILWPVMGSLDAILVPARLAETGLDPQAVRQGYGYLGMAGQLVYLPTVLSAALSASLVPAVAEALTEGRRGVIRTRVHHSLRLVSMVSIPAAVGLGVLADPIAEAVFGYHGAASPLRILAAGAVFLGWFQTSTGVLHGLGRPLWPLMSVLVCALLKTGLTYTLTAMPELGIRGAAWATVVSYAVAALLNVMVTFRLAKIQVGGARLVMGPAVAASIMGLAVYGGYGAITPWLPSFFGPGDTLLTATTTLIALVPAGVLVYGVALAACGGVTARDVALLPLPSSLKDGLMRRRWIRVEP